MNNDWLESPFEVRGEWSWPRAFPVRFEAGTAVIRGSDATDEPIELRALMLLEAGPAGVLRQPATRVRIELEGAANHATAERAALRLGLFEADVRSRIELCRDGQPVAIGDGLYDSPDLPHDRAAKGVRIPGSGFAPLGRALDTVLERLSSTSEGDDDVDDSPIVVVSRGSRPHPRLAWPLRHLAPAIRELISTSHLSPERTGWIGDLERSLAKFREELRAAPGLHRDREYPFILEHDRALESIWKTVSAALGPRERRLLHSAVANLKSSQAFALNILGGLQAVKVLVPALAPCFPGVVGAEVEFEVFDDGTRAFLGESDPEHQTQLDALLTLTMASGSVLGVVVEVKLTERAFGACRGPRSAENTRRELCSGREPERADGCYLKARHGRRYLEHLSLLPASFAEVFSVDGGCPLRSDGYQVARNLLFAEYLRTARMLMDRPRRFDDTRMAVLCVEQTGALSRNAERLSLLGIQVLDARKLVAAARENVEGRQTPDQSAFFDFLDKRYRGFW